MGGGFCPGGGGPGGLVGWESKWGNLRGTCPQGQPSNHTITLNLTLTFAASQFGHASHADWAEQDPASFFHGCFC